MLLCHAPACCKKVELWKASWTWITIVVFDPFKHLSMWAAVKYFNLFTTCSTYEHKKQTTQTTHLFFSFRMNSGVYQYTSQNTSMKCPKVHVWREEVAQPISLCPCFLRCFEHKRPIRGHASSGNLPSAILGLDYKISSPEFSRWQGKLCTPDVLSVCLKEWKGSSASVYSSRFRSNSVYWPN